MTPLNTIFSWFETGDYPTQEQFQASWSSFYHKSELIPVGKIDGLAELFSNTLNQQVFYSHVEDPNAHSTFLAKLDASNLSSDNVDAWKTALNVGDLPPNILTHDLGEEIGNGLTKDEIENL